MNPTNREARDDIIAEIVGGLTEAQKTIYVTLYFETYTWAGLKRQLGLINSNWDSAGEDESDNSTNAK